MAAFLYKAYAGKSSNRGTLILLRGAYTLPPEMFGLFGSVWCKMALGEVGVSLP